MITMGTIIPILIKIEIGTLIISFSIKSAVVISLSKAIADNGYKLDANKIKKFTINNKKNDSIYSYFPIINIIYSLYLYYQVTNEKILEDAINEMKNQDLIIEMSDEEKEEYKKNPTGTNALRIAINYKNKENLKKELQSISNQTASLAKDRVNSEEETKKTQKQIIKVPEEIIPEQQPKPKDKTPTAEQIEALRKLRDEMIKEARGLTTESVAEDAKEGPQKINRRLYNK